MKVRWPRRAQPPAPAGGGVLMFLAAVPFTLLLNSNNVYLTTHVEPDASGRRVIIARAPNSPELRSLVRQSVAKVNVGVPWDRRWSDVTSGVYELTRDARVANLDNPGASPQLTCQDVFQNPFSLYTTYTWQEKVDFSYADQAQQTIAAVAGKSLVYTLIMPGKIVSASSQPMGGARVDTDGDTATFTLNAGTPSYTVSATAHRMRWGYLILVLYVAVFIVYRVLGFVAHQVHIRPRKI